ncbi:hypothetical protein Mal64_07720 [Pseudobythopirellula maris]|uniref:Uncharacterized protein n=1 Tax=Pseudobythopirellula maris TaxID=2527991 RepID=A0A5C5ZVW1_9BACT|nr:hypothetical protein [Pseudobythopirellula maris]TWT90383.1 hypothetical protein Mal64_07720 [Pseudobythopirellula maris]
MTALLKTLSLLALVGVLAPSVLFVVDAIELERVKTLTLVATVAWFVITPIWMGRHTVTQLEPQGQP